MRTAYAAAGWAGAFALINAYWAAGGDAGLDTLGVVTERDALARDGGQIALFALWAAIGVAAAWVALALARSSSPPRWAVWGALGFGTVIGVYGAEEVIEKLLVKLDVNPVHADLGAGRVDWHLFLWDPFLLVGGLLFMLAALNRVDFGVARSTRV